MVKSLEQYLSDLNFSPPEKVDSKEKLSAGERAFVEKYLGLDALDALPRVDPQPLLEQPPSTRAPELKLAEPPTKLLVPEIVVVPSTLQADVSVDAEGPEIAPSPAPVKNAQREEQESQIKVELKSPTKVETAPAAADAELETEIAAPVKTASPTLAPAAAPAAEEQAAQELSLKDSMRQQEEIQAVSFFVSGQLFLLPVEGIQEVLRHMELIRVPQAPSFVAGVINLRGKVTPLVHLSAILTNVTEYVYDPEKNFIIICGTEPLQVGLIIDRINSMHLLPQDKIIWNVESKLGEAADFLYAIVNLDEKVCGMVAPEMITKKILSTDS